ncbi:IS110 family transposase [Pedobacter sp. HMWF019]|uniref:transposase n=1 Tax=Pedobacter sp. HMWF019 TaxID=2056856 RepID=UPI000D3B4F18|nr:transposase [Pedobacter sp. HMWF019]PTS94829.1 IS110 family transposase [Pedobacter sp. HMWF019]
MAEAQFKRIRRYTWFIGVDISKNKLDFSVMHNMVLILHKEITNDVDGIKSFIIELKTLEKFSMIKSIFVMEKIGFYSNHLTTVLLKIKANIVMGGAFHIKRTLGLVRGKTDKIDSIRLAEFAFIRRESLVLWKPKRPIINELAMLCNISDRLLTSINRLAVPINEQKSFIGNKQSAFQMQCCNRSISSLKADLLEVDSKLLSLIREDPELKRLFELIVSVDFVGPKTAIRLLISTNEFNDIKNPKQFACLIGIAPFPRESGTMRMKMRVSNLCDKKLKSILHICALCSLRGENGFKSYFKRKTENEGKPGFSVLNAIKNKIILRIFACVNQNRPFEKEYLNPKRKLEARNL